MLIFAGILFIAIGILNILNPNFAWQLREGWKVDGDSEPSDTYLTLTKISGVLITVAGIFILIIGILT
ncbi:DUF6199 family natural product biosynthesis protein [Paenibacillus macquariensis]|uniref:DUF6199 domain-containing protein n=1 Tax=Paenibacillus macquariensis TaxID=948756 RepID=A0ABY1JX68_9BACL|nr:DUF6199 family natural product biosynthesis protein [Paenibacillus macquariensis]MEC0089355.1 hypothetical protein [Paenibacillus macquariensis]OAB33247.1 hypothetical protein PMSM_14630 [Paenibacillus macquariensis subsp. macquariensis]SIQ93146.1 hypothetical protein SAMN05421578_105103 [Paenibacillus macquariensis]